MMTDLFGRTNIFFMKNGPPNHRAHLFKRATFKQIFSYKKLHTKYKN